MMDLKGIASHGVKRAQHLICRIKVYELQLILQLSTRWHSWEREAACMQQGAVRMKLCESERMAHHHAWRVLVSTSAEGDNSVFKSGCQG